MLEKKSASESYHHSIEKISVLIPCRNEAGNLPALLDDLAAQTLLPAEVWVLDDGSTDDTESLIRFYQNKVPFSLFYHSVIPQAGIRAHKSWRLPKG